MSEASLPTPIEADCLAELAGVRHGFFTREGGVSEGLYASLNCGLGSRDSRSAVEENRARAARLLGTGASRLLTCYQIHSADPVVVSEPWGPGGMPRADALVTQAEGLAVGALAADCAPVLFCDPGARVVAAAHAGWKGALTGILEATVGAMEALGARRARIRAALGPCIGADAYEVGPEFEARFLAAAPANARFFRRPESAARGHFDLPAFVLERLSRLGLDTVESAHACTYADARRFFSYRRSTHEQAPDYGRQVSAIMLL